VGAVAALFILAPRGCTNGDEWAILDDGKKETKEIK
jgi:hypothetical protein